ncbi:MAG: deoxyribose-phosphate aldolase [Staphylothermus sp.]|nr:deoxyribose-phosphate aldolase [Staphylothermus sp.]
MSLVDILDKYSVSGLAKMIDHTILKPTADYSVLEKYIEDYKKYGFAVLMVSPSLLSKVREIAGNTIRLATVVGFPLGSTFTEAKVLETKIAVENGAEEIDMVMNINLFKSREYMKVLNDMKAVVEEAKRSGAKVVKVIIETGLLSDEEKVKAVELVVKSGADYVKTSTGFIAGGATIHDVALLRRSAKNRVKVKAAGGIRHALDTLAMIEAGASRIGTSTGDKIMEEFIKLKESI